MIERTTRCPEAVPLFSISIEVCVRAFISTLISRFGVPATLTSDRGHNSCHPSGPKYAVSSELQPLRLQVFILFSSKFLSKMEKAIACFSIPWPHHVIHSQFVFIREDASKHSIAPLYRSPYLDVEQRSKFFGLQIGTRVDSVSCDFCSPVTQAVPPLRWCLPLLPRRRYPEPASAIKSSYFQK